MATPEKYAFSALVQDKNQPLQLMAYSIYKADKTEIAENLKIAQKTQAEIDAEIQAFHDAIINSSSLRKSYHVRARALGQNLIAELKDGVAADARQDFIDRMGQLVLKEKTVRHHIGVFITEKKERESAASPDNKQP